MIIQYLLLLSFATVLVALLRRRRSLRSAAVRRILLMLASVVGSVAVLRPSFTTEVAQAVGVGRGADLVLYLLAAVSFVVWTGTHLRFRDYDEQIVLLTRRLAIAEALAAKQEPACPDAVTELRVPAPRSADAARTSLSS